MPLSPEPQGGVPSPRRGGLGAGRPTIARQAAAALRGVEDAAPYNRKGRDLSLPGMLRPPYFPFSSLSYIIDGNKGANVTMDYTIHPIATIHTDFADKFGIPRQSGLVPELTARIVFEPEYRDPNALVGIEGYDRLWLIWQFSTVAAEYAAGKSWRPTVRPPRLGGNERRGVFATRSPYRPNALGLSCVELAGVENGELIVRGADLLDGTPIFDIKPYLPYVDAHPDARGGFTDTTKEYALQVECPDTLLCKVPEEKRTALLGVLKNDPRPAYQHDPERVYALDFGGNNVKFTVAGDVLKVVDIV